MSIEHRKHLLIRILTNFHLLKITALFLGMAFNLHSFKKSFSLKILFQESKLFKIKIFCMHDLLFTQPSFCWFFSLLVVCM